MWNWNARPQAVCEKAWQERMSVALRPADCVSRSFSVTAATPVSRRAKLTMQRIEASWSARGAVRSVCMPHLVVAARRCS